MSPKTDTSLPTRSYGFTLIELLVVLAIIATLVSVVAPAVFGHVSDARQNAARSQIEILALALEAYNLDNGSYPTADQGLESLRSTPAVGEPARSWRGPYLRKAVPTDPWGRPYHYLSPGHENPQSYDLFTLGRDGRIGGAREDADLTSWGGAVRQ